MIFLVNKTPEMNIFIFRRSANFQGIGEQGVGEGVGGRECRQATTGDDG